MPARGVSVQVDPKISTTSAPLNAVSGKGFETRKSLFSLELEGTKFAKQLEKDSDFTTSRIIQEFCCFRVGQKVRFFSFRETEDKWFDKSSLELCFGEKLKMINTKTSKNVISGIVVQVPSQRGTQA